MSNYRCFLLVFSLLEWGFSSNARGGRGGGGHKLWQCIYSCFFNATPWRDLQRHRKRSCERALVLSTRNGRERKPEDIASVFTRSKGTVSASVQAKVLVQASASSKYPNRFPCLVGSDQGLVSDALIGLILNLPSSLILSPFSRVNDFPVVPRIIVIHVPARDANGITRLTLQGVNTTQHRFVDTQNGCFSPSIIIVCFACIL